MYLWFADLYNSSIIQGMMGSIAFTMMASTTSMNRDRPPHPHLYSKCKKRIKEIQPQEWKIMGNSIQIPIWLITAILGAVFTNFWKVISRRSVNNQFLTVNNYCPTFPQGCQSWPIISWSRPFIKWKRPRMMAPNLTVKTLKTPQLLASR